MVRRFGWISVLLALAASGCGAPKDSKQELDRIDNKLGGKGNADPALTAAVEDPIMVDPQLSGQANKDSIRPADTPFAAPIPPGEGGVTSPPGRTLAALAARQAQIAKDKFNGCSLDVAYSMQWANRLPVELPLYPQGACRRSGGSDYQGCSLRVVTYAAPAPPRSVAGYYLALANRSGFRSDSHAEGQGFMVSAWRPSDGAAFYATLQPSGTGTSVDLVSNRGR